MKKFLFLLIIMVVGIIINLSCTKTGINTVPDHSHDLNSTLKVIPSISQCGAGQQWDYYLGKCVDVCPSGYHNDSITGACVVNGGSNNITLITNPNNPYDYIGQKHNNGCTVLLGEVNQNSPTFYNDVLHYTKLYLNSQSYDTTIFNNWYSYALSNGYYNLPDSFYTNHPDSLTNKFYYDGLISTTAKDYMNSINSVIDNTIGDNDPNSTLYNSAASQLIIIENDISNDNSLTSTEKQGLLSMSAIARYSGAYWGNYIINNSGGVSPLRLFKKGWWKSFWHADVGGAIAGAIAGLFTGGVIINTVGGGLGASVANLFGF